MKNCSIVFISAFLFAFLPLISWSQTDSLNHYLEIAAKNNPAVMQRFTEYKAALQKIPQVGSLPDPEINFGVFLSPMELVEGKQVADIRLMQMFPWFGVIKNAKDEMSLMAKAKFETFRDAKSNLFYDLQRTWYELYKYQQELIISEKNVEILKTIERLSLIKFKSPLTSGAAPPSTGNNPGGASNVNSNETSGMGIMGNNNNVASSTNQSSSMNGTSMASRSEGSGLSDLYRIQIEIGELQNNIETLKNQIETITSRFNTYLSRPAWSSVITPDTIIPEVFYVSTASFSDSILLNNPMLGMLKYEQQSLDARYRMVNAMGYPMVGVGINYSLINKSDMSVSSMNGKDMVMPMVTITLPVYRKKYTAMKSEVELLKNAASMGYQATSNSLQAEYYQALQLFRDAQRRLKLYADQYMLADKSLNIILMSFSSSGSSLSDILRVRQQTLDYKIKLVEAVADFNTSIAWLKKLGAMEINKTELK